MDSSFSLKAVLPGAALVHADTPVLILVDAARLATYSSDWMWLRGEVQVHCNPAASTAAGS